MVMSQCKTASSLFCMCAVLRYHLNTHTQTHTRAQKTAIQEFPRCACTPRSSILLLSTARIHRLNQFTEKCAAYSHNLIGEASVRTETLDVISSSTVCRAQCNAYNYSEKFVLRFSNQKIPFEERSSGATV